MTSFHDFFRQALWLSAVIVPIPAAAFSVHTPNAVMVSLLSFLILGMAVPFFYFLIRGRGYGAEYGQRRAAVHLICTFSVTAFFWEALWLLFPLEEKLHAAGGAAASLAAAAAVMTAAVVIILRLDYFFMRRYEALKAGGAEKRYWLALAFFTGAVPGSFLLAMLTYSVSGFNGTLFFVFFVTNGLTWALWMKTVIGLMSICFYLYFALPDEKMKRLVRTGFTGIFWFFLLYAPVVISARLTAVGPWRAWADPAYLAIFPYASDLWLTALALLAGRKVTDWIWQAAE